MDNNKKVSFSCGGGICSTLFIVFLILKLVGVINWSWWLVCLPLIIGVGLWVLFALIILILAVIAAICN